MNSACRRCIRKAEKSGVQIEEASDATFVDDYYTQLQDVFAKQGLVPTYPRERVRALVEHVLPTGRLLLVRARSPDGTCIATGIFPAMNDTMFFWGGASLRQHQILRPNEMVQWFAMRYWKARGIRRYDMGGGGEYKRKYGGREIAVPWIRKSRHPVLESLRNNAKYLFSLKQRLLGWGKR
jgi:predicted N-acyltransferase